LAQGVDDRVVATNTIDFIHKSEVPPHKTVTYGNCVCDYRPLKSKPYCVRLTVGGNKLPSADESGSPAASLLETKLIINSTISDASRGARFLCADLKDHFLASPMKDPEFMRLKYKYFPEDIRKQYKLENFVAADDYMYIRIKKCSLLAYQHLVKQLVPHGYHPCPYTTGVWQHALAKPNYIYASTISALNTFLNNMQIIF
jgi:hypothetical protein